MLASDQTFTVVSCEELVYRDGAKHRLVKLRNAFVPNCWKGPLSSSDSEFWKDPEQGHIFQGISKDKRGYFVMYFE